MRFGFANARPGLPGRADGPRVCSGVCESVLGWPRRAANGAAGRRPPPPAFLRGGRRSTFCRND
eukprot:10588081-Lingulodinium_polyedra.AAC.1